LTHTFSLPLGFQSRCLAQRRLRVMAAEELSQGNDLALLRSELCLLTDKLLAVLFELLLLSGSLVFALLELRLLLFEGVNKGRCELIIFLPFDLPFGIAEGQQWFDLLDFFSAEANIFLAVLFPSERNRT